MSKTIGILGGMGPLATADLFRKITCLTKASCDNDHIRVYIDSNARIPDRTAAIPLRRDEPRAGDDLCTAASGKPAARTASSCRATRRTISCRSFRRRPKRRSSACSPPRRRPVRRSSPGKTAAILGTKGTLATGLSTRARWRARAWRSYSAGRGGARHADAPHLRCGQGVEAARTGAGDVGSVCWTGCARAARTISSSDARSCPSWPIRCRWKARSSTRRRSWRRRPSVSAAAKRWKTEQYSDRTKRRAGRRRPPGVFALFTLHLCSVLKRSEKSIGNLLKYLNRILENLNKK